MAGLSVLPALPRSPRGQPGYKEVSRTVHPRESTGYNPAGHAPAVSWVGSTRYGRVSRGWCWVRVRGAVLSSTRYYEGLSVEVPRYLLPSGTDCTSLGELPSHTGIPLGRAKPSWSNVHATSCTAASRLCAEINIYSTPRVEGAIDGVSGRAEEIGDSVAGSRTIIILSPRRPNEDARGIPAVCGHNRRSWRARTVPTITSRSGSEERR